jgi:Helix-hairpin-helix containing domain/AAA domain
VTRSTTYPMSDLTELTALLAAGGVPATLAPAVAGHFGPDAAGQLRADPWQLLALPGVRPEQADHFARQILGDGTDPGDERRGRALVTHLLMQAARHGHTVLPVPEAVTRLKALKVPDPVQSMRGALDEGQILGYAIEDPEDFEKEPDEVLSLERWAMAEEAVAEGIMRLSATAETREGSERGVTVLTGPGTAAAVSALREQGAVVATLTDRAGGISLHRLLEARETPGGVTYARGEQWPLEAGIVVVTDAGGLDVELAAALVEACADGTHLVLAGDPAGLPPIMPGQVLADVIASGTVPVVDCPAEPGGPLERLGAAVRLGELPPVDAPNREVVLIAAKDPQEAVYRVVQLVTDSIPRALGIAVDDVQVLTPAQGGAAGTAALNAALKERLNPGPGAHGGFDVGDRIVVTSALPQAATGETGVVGAVVADGGLEISFPAGTATVPAALLSRLRHGWAITVQRSAGTRWPAVVAVLTPDSGPLLSRPLVVTATGRALAHLSVVHAAGPALAKAVREVRAPERRTRLAGLLREG